MIRDALALFGLCLITLASFMTTVWLGLLVLGLVLLFVAVVLSVVANDEPESRIKLRAAKDEPKKAEQWSGINVDGDKDAQSEDTLTRLLLRDKPRFREHVPFWREVGGE